MSKSSKRSPDSRILENAATTNVQGGVEGGGIFSGASLTITRSTVSGNAANNRTGATGGGIRAENTTSISNSTITDNRAGGANSAGGLFRSAGTAIVRSSIIAANQNNQTIPDIAGAFDPTSAFNLIGNVGTATGFSAANRNQIGTSAARLNPLLEALMENGGAAPTHRLLSGSPAIDKGNSFGLTTDQRGATRPVDNSSIPNATGGDGSDIGAFEVSLAPTAATVSVSGRVTTADGGSIMNVRLTLTDSQGNTITTTTDSSGNYRFDDVQAGETYILTATAKRFTFSQPVQVLNVNEEANQVNFIANSEKRSRLF